MTTLINNSNEILYCTAQLNNGSSYQTTIPVGGGWTPPDDVVAVLIDDES